MKKHGFTLVELLAVIAILAILVIIALPNVMGMFNQAKKSSFTTEIKEVYKVAQNQWMMDSLTSTGEKVYSRCKTCTGKSLDLSGRTELEYYIKIDKSGRVVEYHATDGTYQFSYTGDLLATNITGVESVAELNEEDKIVISSSGVSSEPTSFALDSWRTIANAVRNNNTSVYHVGDTKSVDLGEYGVHQVRIVNKSTPSACNNSNFSQTSCGFVIEFTDIIDKHYMNPYQSMDQYGTSQGGYRSSAMKTYLSTTVYDKLPSSLKSVIVNTNVVVGNGPSDSSKVSISEKLFLLTAKEVLNYTGSDETTGDVTRQLDYYSSSNVSNDNPTLAKKSYNGSSLEWWLRSVRYSEALPGFLNIGVDGKKSVSYPKSEFGISPAFKVG